MSSWFWSVLYRSFYIWNVIEAKSTIVKHSANDDVLENLAARYTLLSWSTQLLYK